MTMDTFAQNILKGLREGNEINWDYVTDMVTDGQVRREDALSSLRGCLDIVIPEYRRNAQNEHYFTERLVEAESALASIVDGITVTFRGHTLPAPDSGQDQPRDESYIQKLSKLVDCGIITKEDARESLTAFLRYQVRAFRDNMGISLSMKSLNYWASELREAGRALKLLGSNEQIVYKGAEF